MPSFCQPRTNKVKCYDCLPYCVHCTLHSPNAALQGCCVDPGIRTLILLRSAHGKKHINKQIHRLRVDVTEEQIVSSRNRSAKSFEANITHMRLSRSQFTVINFMCFLCVSCCVTLPLSMCVGCYLRVCSGLCESPWTGRLPPQPLHSWSTGCALRAWPRGSRRSGCTESRPSAGAPGIPRPLGPPGELEEKHTQIHALKRGSFMQVCTHTYK